jgi:hypothetical protein
MKPVLPKSTLPLWPAAIVEEVGTLIAHWTAGKAAMGTQLWPATPAWLNRYWDEMLNAHAHSLNGKSA